MIIGVPKEIMPGEHRVSSAPETVERMVKSGLTVLVEKGAGLGAFYRDEEYIRAGAEMLADCEEIFRRADLILKVKEPLFNEVKQKHELDMMHEGQYLLSFIHPAAPANHEMVKKMAARGIISLTLDGIPRIERAQNLDALTSMSICAGYKGIIMAGNLLPKFIPEVSSEVGVTQPINVLVIGTGVSGLHALATAQRLGAVTYAADIRPSATEQAASSGAKVIDLGINPEDAVSDGGNALSLSQENIEKGRAVLARELPKMDIVFCSALVPGELAPVLITEEMVKSMTPGSVIVDISIDQGGNCEITPPGAIEVKHQVTIIGVKNIPGMLPTSSTWMFANNVANFVDFLVKDGKIVLDMDDEIIQSTLTTYGGEVVHKGARKAMNLD